MKPTCCKLVFRACNVAGVAHHEQEMAYEAELIEDLLYVLGISLPWLVVTEYDAQQEECNDQHYQNDAWSFSTKFRHGRCNKNESSSYE